MIYPVVQHQLIKISAVNKAKLLKVSLILSFFGCSLQIYASSTNNWLTTSEVLKYYVFPNNTDPHEDGLDLNRYFKNATLGPWRVCWLDPTTEYHCNDVDFISTEDDAADVTTAIELSGRKAIIFMICGVVFSIGAFLTIIICCLRKRPYRSLFISTLLHIFAGISTFTCIIVFMSSATKEIGDKVYPPAEMDDPLFYYHYGISFISLKIGFMCTEAAALLSTIVYMSKRDAKTYERYKMRGIMKTLRVNSINVDPLAEQDLYRKHTKKQYQIHRLSGLYFTDLSSV
uniref:Uncharacterized protein n=1 Tax=Rhabditophanes sp. KR3021 TaxID=114890 RepID=A0AC35U5R9_9BILA